MRLIPRSHPIPRGIVHERFRMRPLTVGDVVGDYDAVMSSVERLRERFPHWDWPAPDMSLEQNLIDLGWHQKEGQLRRSFAYTVLSPDETRVLGCVYVDPPAKRGADAEVCLWVRADEEDGDLERVLEGAVREWLAAEWPFETIRWPGRDVTWEEWEALPDA